MTSWNFDANPPSEPEAKPTGYRVSDSAASAMRWIGGIIIGVMLTFLGLFWHQLLDKPVAFLLYIIPPSTIGVLLCILGMLAGYFNRLLDVLRDIRRERAGLRRDMQAMVTDVELDHVRREHAVKDMLETVVDQLRVVASVQAEQALAIQSVHRLAVKANVDHGEMAVVIGELCARLDGNSERIGRVDQVVRQCLGVLRPKANKQQQGGGGKQLGGPQEIVPPEALNGQDLSNVRRLPPPDTLDAARRLARRTIRQAEDNPEDKS